MEQKTFQHVVSLILLVIAFGIVQSANGKETAPVLPEPGVYQGWIEDIYPFIMDLEEIEGELTGRVIFPLSGDSLFVEVNEIDQRIMFTEFDHSHTLVGYYFFDDRGEYWEGNWQNHDGTIAIPVYLSKKPQSGFNVIDQQQAKNNKWLESYRFDQQEMEGSLIVANQGSLSLNGQLYWPSKNLNAHLNGECRNLECTELLLFGQAGEREIFIEFSRNNPEKLIAIYVDEKKQELQYQKNRQYPAETLYSFNKYFIFDAIIPNIHPLLTAALKDKTGQWIADASQNFNTEFWEENPTMIEKFSNRNYVWIEITHIDINYISGFAEWINGNASEAIEGFFLDKKNSLFYWESDFFTTHLTEISRHKAWENCNSEKSGTFSVLPGGIEYISALDPDAGRTYCFANIAETRRYFPRFYRKWIERK